MRTSSPGAAPTHEHVALVLVQNYMFFDSSDSSPELEANRTGVGTNRTEPSRTDDLLRPARQLACSINGWLESWLARLLENLMNNQGIMSTEENPDGFRDALKDNPFSFKPEQEKMAAFHAKATLTTRQPASSYYEHAQAYFTGQASLESWDGLGFQGIADFVMRLEQENNQQQLTQLICQLPGAAWLILEPVKIWSRKYAQLKRHCGCVGELRRRRGIHGPYSREISRREMTPKARDDFFGKSLMHLSG